ncbi:polysaccharide transporter, PST family [Selenomonas ruminantium]|uniref:Polysaccharide transporter, PST family n=1 Tax=Selenomonas ruminantium TaxID=971 RepID=A0A1M6XNA0_SELRU|nr:oligosaccharide flippase family protein [Selenomonas ruminantium]SHL07275.1 polysaccharide transporter, PST family [Selenomonas ruminantium]
MEIKDKVRTATKWTLITEFLAKIISPVTGMVLARLLTPEAFGVMASIMVVTSFAEMFADAGFQKYFVQHEFYDEEEKRKCFGTAITTSCLIALVIWLLIIYFADEIAVLLGAEGVADGIKVAGFGLVLTSYNGMQAAIFKREFQFKLLFKLRMVAVVIPLLVTIPLAYYGLGFWSLVWGTLAQQGVTCLVQAHYTNMPLLQGIDGKSLFSMLSFSLWTLFESITIWFSTYGGLFLVGVLLSSYYLGLYRGILTLTGAAFGMITGAIIPVLFTALSRLQNNMVEFKSLFYGVQSKAALVLMPIGVLLMVFADVSVSILLGEQWHDGDFFFGVWSLTTTFSILINSLASEAIRAKGMPRLSAFSQVLHFPVMWGGLWYGSKVGFDAVALGMCASSLWLDVVKLVMLRQVLGFSVWKMTGNIINAALPATVAGVVAWELRQMLMPYGIVAVIMAIAAFGVCYLLLLLARKDNRRIVMMGMMYLRERFIGI